MPMICYVPKSFRPATIDRIGQANEIIAEYQAQGFKLTLRQLYYQHVARALIPNTMRSYKSLGDIINDGRLAGLIDWDAIEDRTRNLQSQSHWAHPRAIVRTCAAQFTVNLWATQDNYVEIWIEKEALVGVLEGICTELDVSYFACKGYTSQSEMWVASQRLIDREKVGKTTTIIHLGDHDPSGIDMTRDIQDRLELFGSTALIQRIALNSDQVAAYSLPPNPAKATDSRYEEYRELHGDECWELDALEPKVIVELIRRQVEDRIDQVAWQEALGRQETGREQLAKIAKRWTNVIDYLGEIDE